MPRKLRIAYFVHSLRSDWNNGNAHFLRGLMRAVGQLGHEVVTFEHETEWSLENLRQEERGDESLRQFAEIYPELRIERYSSGDLNLKELLRERLRGCEVVILHEWNPPALARLLLDLRAALGFMLLFHDTHHRASSSPEQMELFGLARFDGVIAFGEALRSIYRERFGIERVWTLHEAADTTVFKPLPETARARRLVWVGNWGEGERAEEICEYLLRPAAALRDVVATTIFGVRYPAAALEALHAAGVEYGGYLPNLASVPVYAAASATVHVPRQQYAGAMKGIPTIRVFEALACGVPLVSAPWEDTEGLFREGDFRWAGDGAEMTAALRELVEHSATAEEQAARGLETVLARHTCAHRALELTGICEEVLA